MAIYSISNQGRATTGKSIRSDLSRFYNTYIPSIYSQRLDSGDSVASNTPSDVAVTEQALNSLRGETTEHEQASPTTPYGNMVAAATLGSYTPSDWGRAFAQTVASPFLGTSFNVAGLLETQEDIKGHLSEFYGPRAEVVYNNLATMHPESWAFKEGPKYAIAKEKQQEKTPSFLPWSKRSKPYELGVPEEYQHEPKNLEVVPSVLESIGTTNTTPGLGPAAADVYGTNFSGFGPETSSGFEEGGFQGMGYGKGGEPAESTSLSQSEDLGYGPGGEPAETTSLSSSSSSSSSDGGPSVLCTELHRQGYLSDEIFEADTNYSKRFSTTIMAGYHAWGRPLARLMKNNKLVTAMVKPLVSAWARNMAFKMGICSQGSRIGAIIEGAGVPVCKIIGTIVEAYHEFFSASRISGAVRSA